MVSYEEFSRLDLRVARVLEAEGVEGSNKLLKLVVDSGKEKRRIVAGIARSYKPEELPGKNIIIVANMDSSAMLKRQGENMKFNVSGIIDVPNGRRKFSKEVEAKSEKHAKEMVYSLFGSSTGINRNRVKIESVAKVG